MARKKAREADATLDARVVILDPKDMLRDEALLGSCPASPAPLDVSGGIRRPVILWRKEDGSLAIVDGLRRVEGARSAGIEAVAAYVFEGMDETDARNLRELANTFDRGLGLRERSDILTRLSPWAKGFEEGRWRNRSGRRGAHPASFASAMSGVGISNVAVAFRLADRLDPEVVTAVDEGLLAMKVARELAAYDRERQREVVAEIRESGVSGSYKVNRIARAPRAASDHVEKALEHMQAASEAKDVRDLDELQLAEIATLALELIKRTI